MQMKKVVSLIMVLVMMLTVAIIPGTFSAANKDAAATASQDYALAPNIQSGNILHAFNWRMRDLVKYAPEIAAAGYTSVQISPIQKTKATVNDGSYATDWWSFYQPTDFTVGNALGTAADLQAATTELHKYGIKVIADVVTNHLQNCTTRQEVSQVSSTVRGFARNSNLLNHTTPASDGSRDSQTQNDLDGQLSDINTANTAFQQYVISNLLNPLADNGVDGFRFDAAKHIETPKDSKSSNYWPTITNAIKAKNSNAYIYGEILDNAGKFNISNYTEYMNVTDWAYGNTVRSALSSKNASNLVNYGYTGSSKNQNVLWVESHDNFCANVSTSLTKKQQILGWAAIGGRKDAPALFFVRPKHEALDSAGFIKYDELMGAPGSAETWKDPTVVAVNHFKNAFAGQAEDVKANGSKLFVQRGTTGMLIVDLNGSAGAVSQACSMANGSYKDQVSGNTFQVSGGKITGNIGSTGVAVVYNTTADNSAPEIKLSLNNVELTPEVLSRYTAATASIKVDVKNATSYDIKVSNLAAKTVTDASKTFTLNSTIPYGKSVDITVTATNGKKTVERTYNIKKKDPNETKKVYFDNSIMKWPYENTTGQKTVGIFVMCKTGVAASTKIGSYDSHKMTPVSGQTGLYSYDVPANTKYVKFNEGFIGSSYTDKSHVDAYGRCHLFHTFSECQGYCGRTMPETVVNYGTANSAANRENGGYELVGAMILRDLRFEDYGEYPVATLTNADTSLTAGADDPTQAPTVKPTEKPVGRPILRGDADQDTVVCILDATMMQRHLANVKALSADGILAADIDSKNSVTATDVTLLQRYLAGMGNPYNVEKIFYVDGDEPDPTTAPTPTSAPQPTTAPEPDPTDPPEPTTSGEPITFLLTDNFGWGSAYVYAWDADGNALCGEWPGAAQAETITNGYGETQFKCTVPEGAVGVILNNGNGAQTEDITDFGQYEGYWMDGTKNAQGHYKVTGWNS